MFSFKQILQKAAQSWAANNPPGDAFPLPLVTDFKREAAVNEFVQQVFKVELQMLASFNFVLPVVFVSSVECLLHRCARIGWGGELVARAVGVLNDLQLIQQSHCFKEMHLAAVAVFLVLGSHDAPSPRRNWWRLFDIEWWDLVLFVSLMLPDLIRFSRKATLLSARALPDAEPTSARCPAPGDGAAAAKSPHARDRRGYFYSLKSVHEEGAQAVEAFSKKLHNLRSGEDNELSLSANEDRAAEVSLHRRADLRIDDNRFITGRLKKNASGTQRTPSDARQSTPEAHPPGARESDSVNDSQFNDFGPKTYSEKSLLSKGDFPHMDKA